LDPAAIAAKLNLYIQSGEAEEWADREATCEVADDEESVFIEEEEALEIWRELPEEIRTAHLDKVPNPDGVMIKPTHNETEYTHESFSTPTESHLRRDPTLLEYDNVKRVHVSQIHDISWKEPVIITNAITNEILAKSGLVDNNRLASIYKEVEVRTGNRETLIDNGITNSKPIILSEALMPPNGDEKNSECGRIVFSPVKELPNDFAEELKPFTDCIPHCMESPIMNKFTLTLAPEGFGIGMHKHKEAMFMLLIGRKKWYMTSSEDLDGDNETHPGFYREKSSHKCIQKEGEILFVPNEWYHEIFNLEYTAGIQALP